MVDFYHILKALHLIAVIFWMAGLLYLPRLFVYHSQAILNGELAKKMFDAESRLLKIIMNPAMTVSFLLGLVLLFYHRSDLTSLWLIIKILFALGLMGFHHFLSKTHKRFHSGQYPYSEKFFRVINEIPAIIIIIIVFMVIVKPF